MGIIRSGMRGVAAGIVGTVAMDALLYSRYRAGGGSDAPAAWEFSASATTFEDAPAPARVAKRIADTVGIDLPESSVAWANNVVHWTTGISWGKVASLAASALPLPPFVVGVVTGATAWGTSYAVLGAIGIYEPISAYDRETLWKDLSAHLVYGAAIGAVLTIGKSRRR